MSTIRGRPERSICVSRRRSERGAGPRSMGPPVRAIMPDAGGWGCSGPVEPQQLNRPAGRVMIHRLRDHGQRVRLRERGQDVTPLAAGASGKSDDHAALLNDPG